MKQKIEGGENKVTHFTSEDGIGQMVERVYKYKCDNCGNNFDDKKEFIEHLKSEFDEATNKADYCCETLTDLGIKNYS